jgi:hypothetical protein
MKRIVRVLVWLVAFVAAALIVLIVAANHNPRSNRIPNWRLNLEQIELAKHEWASERVSATNDTPTFADLRTYFSDWQTNHIFMTNGEVMDPDGGVYTIGRLDEQPSCLIDGHKIHL